ncbi:MAG: glycosyltransferase family 2 protein [Bacilli bacterium]
MKIISVVVPTFNEEKSVEVIYDRILSVFESQLLNYDFELIFADNCSEDNTRTLLRKLAAQDKRVKCIFNSKNFGFSRNVFHALKQGSGEATFLVYGDLQDPPELIVDFISEWEKGHQVVVGQKLVSKENWLMFKFRSIFYWIMDRFGEIDQIKHFVGFGLYDKKFINILHEIDDPNPYLKGIVVEFGSNIKIIQYTQEKSNRGFSNFNFIRNYDVAMQGITSYTTVFLRLAIFMGVFVGFLSFIFAIVVAFQKALNWDKFALGFPSLLVGVFFLGAVQLFFIGIVGEYILSINTRVMKRPHVIEEERINFSEDGE